MSDIMSAISHDIEIYKDRCVRFGEKIKYTKDYYGHLIVDCYGDHAKKLYELDKKEIKNKPFEEQFDKENCCNKLINQCWNNNHTKFVCFHCGNTSEKDETKLYTFAWVMTKEQRDVVNDFVKNLLK